MDDNLGGCVQILQRSLYAVDYIVRLLDRHISVQLQVKLDKLRCPDLRVLGSCMLEAKETRSDTQDNLL